MVVSRDIKRPIGRGIVEKKCAIESSTCQGGVNTKYNPLENRQVQPLQEHVYPSPIHFFSMIYQVMDFRGINKSSRYAADPRKIKLVLPITLCIARTLFFLFDN